jgi:hypothetical protein
VVPAVHETGPSVVNRDVESSPHFPIALQVADRPVDEAWHLAVRVAVVASLLALAVGVTLTRFAGIDARLVLLGTACAGWVIGCHLPVAEPAFHGGSDDDIDLDDLAA